MNDAEFNGFEMDAISAWSFFPCRYADW